MRYHTTCIEAQIPSRVIPAPRRYHNQPHRTHTCKIFNPASLDCLRFFFHGTGWSTLLVSRLCTLVVHIFHKNNHSLFIHRTNADHRKSNPLHSYPPFLPFSSVQQSSEKTKSWTGTIPYVPTYVRTYSKKTMTQTKTWRKVRILSLPSFSLLRVAYRTRAQYTYSAAQKCRPVLEYRTTVHIHQTNPSHPAAAAPIAQPHPHSRFLGKKKTSQPMIQEPGQPKPLISLKMRRKKKTCKNKASTGGVKKEKGERKRRDREGREKGEKNDS